jgi:hypothetical protein
MELFRVRKYVYFDWQTIIFELTTADDENRRHFQCRKKIMKLVIRFLIFEQHINIYSRSVVFHRHILYKVPFDWNTAIRSGRVWLLSEWMQFLMPPNWNEQFPRKSFTYKPEYLFTETCVSLSVRHCIFWPMVYSKVPQILKISRSHLQILGARRMTSSRFHIEDSQFRCAL